MYAVPPTAARLNRREAKNPARACAGPDEVTTRLVRSTTKKPRYVDLPSLVGMAIFRAPVALGLLLVHDLTRRLWPVECQDHDTPVVAGQSNFGALGATPTRESGR
jgi:hypothetical protein